MHAMVHAPMWAQYIFIIATGLIVFFYLVIAWQFWDARSNPNIGVNGGEKAKKALGELVAIFVLCAVSGYVPKLVFKMFPEAVPSLWPVMFFSHVALAGWAGRYAMGRQASHIMARLN